MRKRIWKILGWLAVLLVVLCIGAAVGGGAVYAITRSKEPIHLLGPGPDDPEPGLVIASVRSDGPAAEAGVVRGDILLQVEGETVDNCIELIDLVEEREPGDEVQLTVLHGDDERILTATLIEHEGRPYLGLVPCGCRVGPEPRVVIGTWGPGSLIADVASDSPADLAGLEVGDIIIAVDEEDLSPEKSLADAITAHKPGDTVMLKVNRPGEEARDVEVELGEQPEEKGKAYLGVRYRYVPAPSDTAFEGLRFGGRHFGRFPHVFPDGDTRQGAIVRRVTEESPAQAAGLSQGDLITAIDGDPIEGPRDLVDAVAEHQPGDRVTLTIVASGEEEEREVEVTLAEHPEKEEKETRKQENEAYLGVEIGGFVRVRRWDDERPHGLESFEFFYDWEPSVDEWPFDFDTVPRHFEFHIPSERPV